MLDIMYRWVIMFRHISETSDSPMNIWQSFAVTKWGVQMSLIIKDFVFTYSLKENNKSTNLTGNHVKDLIYIEIGHRSLHWLMLKEGRSLRHVLCLPFMYSINNRQIMALAVIWKSAEKWPSIGWESPQNREGLDCRYFHQTILFNGHNCCMLYCVKTNCTTKKSNSADYFLSVLLAYMAPGISAMLQGIALCHWATSHTHDDVIKWKHFRVTGPLCTGPGEFPTQRPVTRSFDVFFDLRLNKRLSKQPWGWWFETLSWSLWRHWNVKPRMT